VELGDRRVAVCRELTKLHERVVRGSVSEVLEAVGDEPLRGEVVVVVEGDREGAPRDLESALAMAGSLIAEGTRKRDAARLVAAETGVGANEIYRGLIGEG